MRMNHVRYPGLFTFIDSNGNKSSERRKSAIVIEECAYCDRLFVIIRNQNGGFQKYSVDVQKAALYETTQYCCNFSAEKRNNFLVEHADCFEYINADGEKESRKVAFRVWECDECKTTYVEVASKKGIRNIYVLKGEMLIQVSSEKRFECCYCGSLCSI